jgi:hypothetical protein
MEASIVKLYEDKPRTPQQVIASFFGAYRPETVGLLLLHAFRGIALKPPKDIAGASISENDIAALFDQLIDLVAAAATLHQADKAIQPENRITQQEGGQDD